MHINETEVNALVRTTMTSIRTSIRKHRFNLEEQWRKEFLQQCVPMRKMVIEIMRESDISLETTLKRESR